MKHSKMLKVASYRVKAIDDETGAETDLGQLEIRTAMPRLESKSGRLVSKVKMRGFQILKLKLWRFALGVQRDILSGAIKLLEKTQKEE